MSESLESMLVELVKEIEASPGLSYEEKEAVSEFQLAAMEAAAEPGSIEWGNALLRRTWDKALAHAEFGTYFYEEFFKASESLKEAFFAETDMKKQSRSLLNMLRAGFRILHQPQTLQQMLENLGAKHAQYGAETHHYALIGPVGLRALRRTLGDQITPDVETAWNRVYSFIAETMIRASESEQATAFRHKLVKSRCSAFSALLRKMFPDGSKSSVAKFCGQWLDEAVPEGRSAAGQQSEVIASVKARPVEMLTMLLTKHVDSAAVSGNSSDVIGAVAELAPSVLVWMRVCVREDCRDDEARRSITGAFNRLFEKTYPGPLTKFDWTVVGWFVNTLSETLRVGLDKLQVAAPTAPLAAPLGLLVADIEGSSVLFDKSQAPMARAVQQHAAMVRAVIQETRCYEVRLAGNSCFFIAGATVERLVAAAAEIQKRQAALPIVEDLAETTHSGTGTQSVKEGSLRIKIGIHWCSNVAAQGSGTRFDYSGAGVAECFSISAVAFGGQILISQVARDRLQMERESFAPPAPMASNLGDLGDSRTHGAAEEKEEQQQRKKDKKERASDSSFKMVAEDLQLSSNAKLTLWQVTPVELADREFLPTASSSNGMTTVNMRLQEQLKKNPSTVELA